MDKGGRELLAVPKFEQEAEWYCKHVHYVCALKDNEANEYYL